MERLKFLNSIILILGIIFPGNDLWAKNIKVEVIPEMKTKMNKLAEKNNCQPVSYLPVSKSYIKGYGAGNAEDSLVFWCRKHDEHQNKKGPKILKKKFYLMFIFKNENQDFAQCLKVLERYDYAYLDLYKPKDFIKLDKNLNSLENFFYLEDHKKTGPNIGFAHNGILLSDEGYYNLLYCHEGKWLSYYQEYEFKD